MRLILRVAFYGSLAWLLTRTGLWRRVWLVGLLAAAWSALRVGDLTMGRELGKPERNPL